MKQQNLAIALLATCLAAFMGLGEAAENPVKNPNKKCFKCHRDKSLTLAFKDKEEISVFVDEKQFAASAHGKLACTECHGQAVASDDHPDSAFPSRAAYVRGMNRECRRCHDADLQRADMRTAAVQHPKSDEKTALCGECHGPHDMQKVFAQSAVIPRINEQESRLFATKSIEYLLVLSYLAALVAFAWLLRAWHRRRITVPAAMPALAGRNLAMPQGYHLHPGHTWVRPEGDDLVCVGMDHFALGLIGQPSALRLPKPGERLEQAERGWQVQIHGELVDLLSPVEGEVVEVNESVVKAPGLVSEDPYGKGWILKIRVKRVTSAVRSLMPERLARLWIDEAKQELSALLGDGLQPVLQDGGVLIPGAARELAGDRWPQIAARLLLTEPVQPKAGTPVA
ncbi:MAG TPA: hypothetical protein VGP72_21395 [Planctomycetota bacterium]|jgi:glycine cleavage system H lipoate-binding protein